MVLRGGGRAARTHGNQVLAVTLAGMELATEGSGSIGVRHDAQPRHAHRAGHGVDPRSLPDSGSAVRPQRFPRKTKTRIVLGVLAGEVSIAEAARRGKISEQSIGRWKADS
jgi:hypothetical protein